MKKFKFLISFIIISLFISFLTSQVLAVDLTVTCSNTDCVMSPSTGAALFEESDVKPGDNFPQTITVINNGDEDCSLVMGTANEDDPDGLGNVLFTAINDGSNDLFGITVGGRASSDKNLWDLFAAGDVGLGTVAVGGGTNVYNWIVSIDTSVGNEYQGLAMVFDFDLYFACGESTEEPPDLEITKDNNRKGDVLSVGDIVSYTITLANNGPGDAYNVVLKDVQPVGDYFDYKEDSGHLTCSGGTDTDLTATGFNPYYWSIGNMGAGEECTLTYQTEILSVAIPGEHNNIAVAYGQGDDGDTYFSNVVVDPFQVGVALSLTAGYSGEVLGEVLGAAISEIGEVLGAATGSKTFWLILSLLMILAGIGLKLLKKRKASQIFKNLFLILGLSGIILASAVGTVMAADTQAPAVAIVKLPAYFNKKDFEISYTALDAGEAGLRDVHLEYKKEGGSWQDLGTYAESSQKVKLDGTQINEDKKYYFKATACDNENNCASDETYTNIDTSAPPKPENYSKEKIGVQSYKIKWHNPDSDDLDKVYIYRSDKREFDANDSTKVAEQSVSKNTDSEWTDSVVPDSGKEYYYVLCSVDKAGNASGLVGDTYTTYATTEEVAPGVPVSDQEVIIGQELVVQKVGEVLEEKDEAEATTEAQILGGEADEAVSEEIKRASWIWLLVVVVLGLAGVGYWFFKKER